MIDVKELIKPPFQNYDIVVYFGCGLFSLPLIQYYLITPLGVKLPHFRLDFGPEFADIAVATLTLLFSVYLLGHLIAYAASLFIEKTLDRVFGKVSSSIILYLTTPTAQLVPSIRKTISSRLKYTFGGGRRLKSTLRAGFLIPVSPGITFVYYLSYFGYFSTRITEPVFEKIKQKCIAEGLGDVNLTTKWYKSVEHYVTNNHPIATSRMYNYLVISGIFRSLCFIFACACWAVLYNILHFSIHGHYLSKGIVL